METISITRYKCPGKLVNIVEPQQTNWILCYEIGLFARSANVNQIISKKKKYYFSSEPRVYNTLPFFIILQNM